MSKKQANGYDEYELRSFLSFFFLGFRNTVSNWQNSFTSSDFCKPTLTACNAQIYTAHRKGQAQSGATDDIKAAVEMINIYTSNNPKTYQKVNAVLRGQSSGISLNDVQMFREFAKILSMSIDLLCKQTSCVPHNVYRGEAYCVSVIGKTHTFDSFLSTTTNIRTAEGFYSSCSTPTLFKMTQVQGIDVQPYSNFPSESEILVKPTAKFTITEYLNSTYAIANKISSLGGKRNPKVYIEMTMIGFTSASTAISGPKFVGTALMLIIVYTFSNI